MADLYTDYTRDSFVEGVEVREGKPGEAPHLSGYAAVFNQETEIYGPGGVRWIERIAPTAFDGALDGDVIAAVNHDHKLLLGRTRSKTLTLSVDAHGLRYDVTLPKTALAMETVEQVRRGDLSGSSFKFLANESGIRVAKKAAFPGDLPVIVVERLQKVIDVGPVTFPAYDGTSVHVRSVPESILAIVCDAHKVGQPSLLARWKARIAIERARSWA